MKFISKSSNLLIVISPGLSAQPLTGTPAKPTVSVRFKDGVVEIPEGELCDKMLAHPSFNADFISAEQTEVDPYASSRVPGPIYETTNLQHGTPMSKDVSAHKPVLTPALQKVVQEAAASMAKEMLPGMIQVALKELVTDHESSKNSPEKKRRGRPAKKPAVKLVKEIAQEPAQEPVVENAPIAQNENDSDLS